MSTAARKNAHIRINLEEEVESPQVRNGFERYGLRHLALPELDLQAVETATRWLRRSLSLPLLISSMTGGTEEAYRINGRLAEAAQATRIAMGVGSQRIMIEGDRTHDRRQWSQLRQLAPDIPLLANLGIVQLNRGFGVGHCLEAVETLEADALILHCNVLQECVQTRGDSDWSGLMHRLTQVCGQMPVPVIVKEVGWGIGGDLARSLWDAGVWGVDVAGAGGTSWSEVEKYRASTSKEARVAAAFRDWGLPTAVCLAEAAARRGDTADVSLIASGGMRSGIDALKALALGADLVGMAGPFLKRAVDSVEAIVEEIEVFQEVLRIAMLCTGVSAIGELREADILMERV